MMKDHYGPELRPVGSMFYRSNGRLSLPASHLAACGRSPREVVHMIMLDVVYLLPIPARGWVCPLARPSLLAFEGGIAAL
jgi:hypothetical protein